MKREEVDIGEAERGGVYNELVEFHLFMTGEGEREEGERGSISLSPFGLAGTAGFSFFLSAGIGCTSTVGFAAGIAGGTTVGVDTVGRSIDEEARLSIDGEGDEEDEEKEDSSLMEGEPILSR